MIVTGGGVEGRAARRRTRSVWPAHNFCRQCSVPVSVGGVQVISGTCDVLMRHEAQAHIGLRFGASSIVTKRDEDLEVALRSASKTSRLRAHLFWQTKATNRNFLGVSIIVVWMPRL